MILIFSTHLLYLIIPVGEIFIWGTLSDSNLFINNILGESILGLDKLHLAIKYFSQLQENVIPNFINFFNAFWIHFLAQTTHIWPKHKIATNVDLTTHFDLRLVPNYN